MAVDIFDCNSIEEARREFPELADVPCSHVQFKDAMLVLFHTNPITADDLEVFKSITKWEFISAYIDSEKTNGQ